MSSSRSSTSVKQRSCATPGHEGSLWTSTAGFTISATVLTAELDSPERTPPFNSQTQGTSSRRLLPHRLDQHALGALSIPFTVKPALPGTEIQFAFRHRHDDFV